jgi:hypothetical protein
MYIRITTIKSSPFGGTCISTWKQRRSRLMCSFKQFETPGMFSSLPSTLKR